MTADREVYAYAHRGAQTREGACTRGARALVTSAEAFTIAGWAAFHADASAFLTTTLFVIASTDSDEEHTRERPRSKLRN